MRYERSRKQFRTYFTYVTCRSDYSAVKASEKVATVVSSFLYALTAFSVIPNRFLSEHTWTTILTAKMMPDFERADLYRLQYSSCV